MATAAQNRSGIFAMVAGMALFVGNDALMKLARAAFPPGQAVALRTCFALVIALALIGILGDWRKLASGLRPILLLRGLLDASAALSFIWALGLLPLANVTAIGMVSPLLIVVLAVLLRLETVGWRRTAALAVGFLGVLVVIRPDAGGFEFAALLALASAALTAMRDVLTRWINTDIPGTIIALTTIAMGGIVSLGLGTFEVWQPAWRIEMLYLALASLLVSGGSLCIIRAFRQTDVGVVAGYRYSVVVFAVILGYLIWGQTPDPVAFAGIALIVGSGLYTLHRQRVRPDSRLKPDASMPL
ncbi:DMT family transporter [Bosea sp. (in: a-proteobacteria)]|uniref:DMT family transporter n=1 Tax=Bosea sp. (in: a-proteobacteria) TaxID=1871050 RepID=UPI002FC5DA89